MGSARKLAELAGAYNTGGYPHFKNRIINGAMGIWQRGTSFSIAANIPTTYTVDRFYCRTAVCTASVTQQVPSTFTRYPYSARVQRPSGQGAGTLFLAQPFETNNIRDVVGGTATISFVAKCGANYSSTSNVLYLNVYFGTGTERSRGAAVFTSETASYNSVTLTTGEVQYTVTINVPSGTTQMEVSFEASFTGTAGANDWFEITGVQLEKGSTATSFDYRSYGTELALCQRYYIRFIADSAFSQFSWATSRGSTNQEGSFPLPVTMRAAPTTLDFSTLVLSTYAGGTNYAVTAAVINTGSNNRQFANVTFTTGSSAGTGGQALQVLANSSTSAYIGFGAEL